MNDLTDYTAREMNRIKWTLRELHQLEDKAYSIYQLIEDYANEHDDDCIKKICNKASDLFEEIGWTYDCSETRLFDMYADALRFQNLLKVYADIRNENKKDKDIPF